MYDVKCDYMNLKYENNLCLIITRFKTFVIHTKNKFTGMKEFKLAEWQQGIQPFNFEEISIHVSQETY